MPGVSAPALFVSDVHLLPAHGPDSSLVRDLHALLRHAGEAGAALYILGDLFDFWFEYRHAIIRGYLPTLRVLGELADRGVPMTFVPGNHDAWAGAGLEEWGVCIAHGPVRTVIQGRRLVLAHGDGIGVREPWTRVFRAVARHPVTIGAYRMLGPDIGVPLALGISRISRRISEKKRIDAEKIRARVVPALGAEDANLVILGHYHQPTLLTTGDAEFALIADFLHRRSYAWLEGGALHLRTWSRERRGSEVELQGEPVRRAEAR
jgi:UDP-2,3-diacylglucosamine hydrolase